MEPICVIKDIYKFTIKIVKKNKENLNIGIIDKSYYKVQNI